MLTQRCKAPKTAYKSSREKTIINNICLITVSEVFDGDLDPFVAIIEVAVLSGLEIARFPCCL